MHICHVKNQRSCSTKVMGLSRIKLHRYYNEISIEARYLKWNGILL